MDELLKSIACSGTECCSWILVFLNILAVFYLVFCSFWRVSKFVKAIGWIWLAGLLGATVGILIVHTCIYTLLVTIFTAMMFVAILAVIFPKQKTEESVRAETEGMAREVRAVREIREIRAEAVSARLGCYLVSPTDDGRYVFAVYDEERKFIVGSKYSYATLEKAKSEIAVCRDNGMLANVDDRTGGWVRFLSYPKFEMYFGEGKYYFRLAIRSKYILLQSVGYNSENECRAMLEKAKRSSVSFDVYFASKKEKGKNFEHYKETVSVSAERGVTAAPVVAPKSSVAVKAETPKTVVSAKRCVPSAPVSEPAKKDACCPTEGESGFYRGGDVFLRSLTKAEYFEFVDLFINKKSNPIKELPNYTVGGKNAAFFRKFFLYLYKFRSRISDGLTQKIYLHVAKGAIPKTEK